MNIKLSLNGDHNYYNVACATAIAVSLGIELNYIKKKLETFKSISSRLKLFKLDNDIQVIDDCYNANPNLLKQQFYFYQL